MTTYKLAERAEADRAGRAWDLAAPGFCPEPDDVDADDYWDCDCDACRRSAQEATP